MGHTLSWSDRTPGGGIFGITAWIGLGDCDWEGCAPSTGGFSLRRTRDTTVGRSDPRSPLSVR